MVLFVIATLLPYGFLFLGVLFGGIWAWGAVISMTILVFTLDRLMPKNFANADEDQEFPGSSALLVALGVLHVTALVLLAWGVGKNQGLDTGDRVLLIMAAGLIFGQITHPVAHELIHKSNRSLRWLGRLLYSSILFGHHTSAHLRVHHVHVATDQDPNTARLGESYYRFALRAGPGSFHAGLAAENRLRQGKELPVTSHPYFFYISVGSLTLLLSAIIGGFLGIITVLIVSLHAQMQILLSDYVQHYGLRRVQLPTGGFEPVGPEHSWNAAERYSSALTLNAPRHSDHHVRPSRDYPHLHLTPEQMPLLPRSLPVMAMIAMMPSRWRRMMDKRCRKWQGES